MGLIVAFLQLKGGAGKSTACWHVTAEWCRRGRRGVIVDADPQQSLATIAARAGATVPVLSGTLEDARDAAEWRRLVMSVDAEYLTIDLPPRLEDAAEAAAAIAGLVVVPVRASALDLDAAAKTVRLVRAARGARADGGPACLLVPSQVDRRTAAGRELPDALEGFGEPVGLGLGLRAAYGDALGAGEGVTAWAPASASAAEVRALASEIGEMTEGA